MEGLTKYNVTGFAEATLSTEPKNEREDKLFLYIKTLKDEIERLQNILSPNDERLPSVQELQGGTGY